MAEVLGDLLDRVVQQPSGCWEWTGARHRQGYGQTGNGLAHREVFAIVYGLDLDDMPPVLHQCDNPPCVNPLHLRLGTQQENFMEMLVRGRRRKRMIPGNAVMTDEIVTVMRKRARAGESITSLAREFGVTKSAAFQAVRGSSWQFVEEPPVRKNRSREKVNEGSGE